MTMTAVTVLPVFYDVQPTHVTKQSGDFEKAFAKHEQVLKDKAEDKKVEGGFCSSRQHFQMGYK